MVGNVRVHTIKCIDGYQKVQEKIGIFRHVKKTWNTFWFLRSLKRGDKEFAAGKGKLLVSIRDLLD